MSKVGKVFRVNLFLAAVPLIPLILLFLTGRPNPDYGDIRALRALITLYTNRPAAAERDFARRMEIDLI